MRLSPRLFVVLIAIIASVAGFAFIISQNRQASGEVAVSHDRAATESSVPQPVRLAPESVGTTAGVLAQARSMSVPKPLPQSLKGTDQPDGWIQLDSGQNLIATPELRALFDYYLAALGEEPLAQVLARIDQALQVLPEPARSQARTTLTGYLDYRLAVGELESGGTAVSDNAQRIQRMKNAQALRRQYLGADTAEAFFGFEEAIDDFAMDRLVINDNPALSDAEKQARIARAEAQLPAPIREAREASRAFQDYQKRSAELADDPESLRQYRVNRFGEDAADRLAQADQRRAEWDRRWQAYREEADRIEQSGLAASDRAAEIGQLRARYFKGPELARARALDSLASPPEKSTGQ